MSSVSRKPTACFFPERGGAICHPQRVRRMFLPGKAMLLCLRSLTADSTDGSDLAGRVLCAAKVAVRHCSRAARNRVCLSWD